MLYLRRKKSLKIASYFKPSQWTDPLKRFLNYVTHFQESWTSTDWLLSSQINTNMKAVEALIVPIYLQTWQILFEIEIRNSYLKYYFKSA